MAIEKIKHIPMGGVDDCWAVVWRRYQDDQQVVEAVVRRGEIFQATPETLVSDLPTADAIADALGIDSARAHDVLEAMRSLS